MGLQSRDGRPKGKTQWGGGERDVDQDGEFRLRREKTWRHMAAVSGKLKGRQRKSWTGEQASSSTAAKRSSFEARPDKGQNRREKEENRPHSANERFPKGGGQPGRKGDAGSKRKGARQCLDKGKN